MDYWYASVLTMHCLQVLVKFSSVTQLSMLGETKTDAQAVFQSDPSPHKSHTYLKCLAWQFVFKARSVSSPTGQWQCMAVNMACCLLQGSPAVLVGQLFVHKNLHFIAAYLHFWLSTPSQYPLFLKHLRRDPGVNPYSGLIETPNAWAKWWAFGWANPFRRRQKYRMGILSWPQTTVICRSHDVPVILWLICIHFLQSEQRPCISRLAHHC